MRRLPVRRRGSLHLGLGGLVIALTLVALFPARAAAATLTVCPSGCQYTTIQAALSDAQDGDRIEIGPGTYAGGFTIDKDVTLVGAGADLTTISGGGSVVTVAPGTSTTIEQVTITGGTASGVRNNGTLALARSAVSGNVGGGFSQPPGAGISTGGGVQTFGPVSVTKSTVSGNSAAGDSGGGIQSGSSGSVTLDESTVSGNTAGRQGGGISSFGGPVTVSKSTISGNTSASFGGGIASDGPVTLSESTVRDNKSTGHPVEGGGGGGIQGNVDTIYRSTIIGNHSARSCGGIGRAGQPAGGIIIESTIRNNTAALDGGGICVLNPTTLKKTTVRDNTAGVRGGGIFVNAFRPLTLEESTVTKNTAGVDGGGIYNDGGSVTLTNSKVKNNTPNDCVNC